MYAYLDDVFIVVDAGHAQAAVAIAEEVLRSVGLSLELGKTRVWTPDPSTTLPPEVEARRVPELTCLGNTLPFVESSRDLAHEADGAARVPIGSAAAPEPVRVALDSFARRLRSLRGRGLRAQSAWVLFRTYVNGANNHVLRSCWTGEEWCQQYDDAVVGFVEALLGTRLADAQQSQLWLSLKRGGLGLASTRLRRSAAFLASWEQCFTEVAEAQGATSAQALLAQAPGAAAAMGAAGAALRALGAVRYHANWAGCLEASRAKRQRLWGAVVQQAARKRLLAQVGQDDRVDVRSGGAFLLPPSDKDHLMPDDHFVVAARLRLRAPNPGHLKRQPVDQAQQCCHRYVQSQS